MTAINDTVANAIVAWVKAASGIDAVFWSGQNGPRPAAPCIELSAPDLRRVGHAAQTKVVKILSLSPDVIEAVAPGALTLTAHAFLTGDGPVQLTSSNTLPTGYALLTDYWIRKLGADTLALATSFVKAMTNDVITPSDAGVGTHTITTAATCARAGQEITRHAKGARRVVLEMQCFAAGATGAQRAASILDDVLAKAQLPARAAALRVAGVNPPVAGPVTTAGASFKAVVFEPRAVTQCVLWLLSDVSEDATIIDSVDMSAEAVV